MKQRKKRVTSITQAGTRTGVAVEKTTKIGRESIVAAVKKVRLSTVGMGQFDDIQATTSSIAEGPAAGNQSANKKNKQKQKQKKADQLTRKERKHQMAQAAKRAAKRRGRSA